MKLGKKILNKRGIIIVSILLGTLFVLTGCGKAEISVKTYDKENEIQVAQTNDVQKNTIEKTQNVENTSNTQTKETSEYDKANKEIREALKSQKWLEEKGLYYTIVDGSEEWFPIYHFKKIHDIDGMPAYLLKIGVMDSASTRLITYRNNQVYVSKSSAGADYCNQVVDAENNIIKSVNQSVGYTSIYKIMDGELIHWDEYENEEESADQYPINNFEEIETELTDRSIDRYVR